MFGHLRPAFASLGPDDRREYQAAYCGLCGTLGSRYGVVTVAMLDGADVPLALYDDTRYE